MGISQQMPSDRIVDQIGLISSIDSRLRDEPYKKNVPISNLIRIGYPIN